MIKRVVIPAAGLGTRLLPSTKETPKEMLPIFTVSQDGEVCVKPLLQTIFEQLFDVGMREFCFVVSRTKGSIVDHFTSDINFANTLNDLGKCDAANELLSFYEKLNASSIVFINQSHPRGFGDAVLEAAPYVSEPFLVQAGDTYILSKGNRHLTRLLKVHETFKSAATFLVNHIEDPRAFGVMMGDEVERGMYVVRRVVEKPEELVSNLAITALYLFDPVIFTALRSIQPGRGGEIQLTDGIQGLIDSGRTVMAVQLDNNERWLDVGNPGSYWEALRRSHQFFEKVQAGN